MLLFLQSSGVLSLCLALYLGATHGKAPETRRGTGELSSCTMTLALKISLELRL